MNVTLITPDDSAYPADIEEKLGHRPTIAALGNLDLLRSRPIGLFCSIKCPGDAILRTYDLIRALRDAGGPVIGGFHSPMEKECLTLLLRGTQPVIICLCARNATHFHAVLVAEFMHATLKTLPAAPWHGGCLKRWRPKDGFGEALMKIEVLADADAVARQAAVLIAAEARAAVTARGRFVIAVSGGHTPWLMLRALAGEEVPWESVLVVQVDERVAPAGHPDRNLTHIRESLLDHAPLPPQQLHAMAVDEPDLQAAAARYALMLQEIAGSPPVLDLVHLGLGPDGHTASLVPGDPVLNITDADVALTGVYQGRRRMTLTYPIINRSRRILWLVTGSEKAGMLARLRDGDPSIPAGRVRRDQALVLVDQAAAKEGG